AVAERGWHGVEFAAGGERLGGLDLLAAGFQREHAARVDGLAVEHDGAGAAGAAVADALAAGDVEVVAQRIQQRDTRLDVGGALLAVGGEFEEDGRWPELWRVGGGLFGGGRGGFRGDAGDRRRGGAGPAEEAAA